MLPLTLENGCARTSEAQTLLALFVHISEFVPGSLALHTETSTVTLIDDLEPIAEVWFMRPPCDASDDDY